MDPVGEVRPTGERWKGQATIEHALIIMSVVSVLITQALAPVAGLVP